MAAVAGLRGTGDFGTDERPKSFREMIMWRNRTGTAPVTALTSRTNKETVSDPEFNWWDEPMTDIRLQVNATFASTITAITVDSADPDAGSNVKGFYGTATHLKAGDILLVEPATENASFAAEMMIVSAVTSATQITVTRGVAGTTAASIPNDSYLLHIGSAYGEGTASPDAVSRNPIKYNNYCQIFKTAYELTRTAKQTNYRTGDALRNDKKRKMFDHMGSIEKAFLFGSGAETTASNGKPLRYTKGLRRFIPASNATIFTTTVTTSTLLDAIYPAFDYETDAGDERIAFCGNAALNELNKIALASGDVNLGAVITQYGLNLREFIMPQGRLFVRTHPVFNQNTWLRNSMMVIDFSALRYRYVQDTKFMDNIQGNDEDTTKGQWLTEAGLEVFYGGCTMAYLGNISAS